MNQAQVVYVVECQEPDKSWGSVDVFINKDEAIRARRGWRRDAPFHSWRVKTYVPSTSKLEAKP